MSIFSIAIVGIITAFCVMIVRENRPDIAVILALVGGVIILLSVAGYVNEVFSFMKELSSIAGIDDKVLKILLKIVVVGYVADFSAGLVEESGSKSLAEKIVFAGKILIFVLSLPIVKLLLEIITELVK